MRCTLPFLGLVLFLAACEQPALTSPQLEPAPSLSIGPADGPVVTIYDINMVEIDALTVEAGKPFTLIGYVIGNMPLYSTQAHDGAPDAFRIRIWCEDEATATETTVYDNGQLQTPGGGSIVVHSW